MSEYEIRPLSAATWDAFVHLAEKHNGVWNGCWCTWFHPASAEKSESPEGNRAYKLSSTTGRAVSLRRRASATSGPRERTIA